MDLSAAILETIEGMCTAWNQAEAYYQANADEKGSFKQETDDFGIQSDKASYLNMLDRVELFAKQFTRLEKAVKLLQDLKALESTL